MHPSDPIIWMADRVLCVHLPTRKNRLHGSGIMKRGCNCRGGVNPLCPVHILWGEFLTNVGPGSRPWAHISAGKAIREIRRVLGLLQVPGAETFGTHDFRRGHAKVRVFGLPSQLATHVWCSRTCRAMGARWHRSSLRANGAVMRSWPTSARLIWSRRQFWNWAWRVTTWSLSISSHVDISTVCLVFTMRGCVQWVLRDRSTPPPLGIGWSGAGVPLSHSARPGRRAPARERGSPCALGRGCGGGASHPTRQVSLHVEAFQDDMAR